MSFNPKDCKQKNKLVKTFTNMSTLQEEIRYAALAKNDYNRKQFKEKIEQEYSKTMK